MTQIESEIIIESTGALGRIRLNRPKALNSLSHEMIRVITAALDRFESDPKIAAVLISGEGERGLCAGGDIRAIYASGRAAGSEALAFFTDEYRMNAKIAKFCKPYVAFMDGITMGGGVGVSAHGNVRIVTERTRLAMPETGIGFFPDIGATWLLTRSLGQSGIYLGLSGEQIGAADAIYAGLADYYVPSTALDGLVEKLSALPAGSNLDAVKQLVALHSETPAPGILQLNSGLIDKAFAADAVEDILAALQADGASFAQAALAALAAKSPTSLKLSLKLLRLGQTSVSLEQCLEREFTGCHKILAGHDFYEGVRAAVIDKDRNPQWRPRRLAEVSPRDVEAYLAPVGAKLFPL